MFSLLPVLSLYRAEKSYSCYIWHFLTLFFGKCYLTEHVFVCLPVGVCTVLFLPKAFLYPSVDSEHVSHVDVFFMPVWLLFICVYSRVQPLKFCEFCLSSFWCSASLVEGLQSREARLTAGPVIHNVSFTVYELAGLRWNVCWDKQNTDHSFLVDRTFEIPHAVYGLSFVNVYAD